MRRNWSVIALALLLGASGISCVRLLGGERERIADDAGVESGLDLTVPLDRSPPPTEDAGPIVDHGEPSDDQAVTPPDQGPPVLDQTPPVGGACSAEAYAAAQQGDFVLCQAVNGQHDQCTAATLCNGTDHQLCPASTYKAAFATVVPPAAFLGAWIASCVFTQSGGNTAPTDAICGSCASGIWFPSPCQWDCGTSTGGSCPNSYAVGVLAATSCKSIGVHSAATEAYWFASVASAQRTTALCCKVP
jgi:hypothetical protein